MNKVVDKQYDEIINFKIPVLKDFDSLLRCHICKDILNIPVITPCNHTFCSVCIRDYLRNSNDLNCPLCLNDLNESSLRSELLLNEICKCYKSEIKRIFVDKLNTPNINTNHSQNISNNSSIMKKRKMNKPIDKSFSLLKQQQINKKQKTGTNNNSIIDMFSRKKLKSTTTTPNVNNQNSKEKSYCPICNNQFSLKYLQEHHIDHCLISGSSEKKEFINLSDTNKQDDSIIENNEEIEEIKETEDIEEIEEVKEAEEVEEIEENEPKYLKNYLQSALQSDSLNQKTQKLPNLQLNDITTTALKQHLMKYNLPTTGPKYNLIQRWKQWDVLYTSNFIDNPLPLPISSIKSTLLKWDTLNNKPIVSENGSSNSNDLMAMLDNKKLDIKSDKFSRKNWETKNRLHYKQLIKLAKRKKNNLK